MTGHGLPLNHSAQYDVIALGSALLDLTVNIEDSELETLRLNKGEMHLIDEALSFTLRQLLEEKDFSTTPGGSAANAAAGVACHGAQACFIGTVGTDTYGQIYIKETEQSGVTSAITAHKGITGHAITFITPDSERTFATHLGAALMLKKEDLIPEIIASAKILHIEGYFFELPELREICYYAMDIALSKGVLISIDLADPALIGRIKDVFQDVVENYAAIVFANDDEAKSFTGMEPETAAKYLAEKCQVAAVKLGENGSLIAVRDDLYAIPVIETEVENTNGAGDMYAAGVLYGISRGYSFEDSGRLGSYSASLVVSQKGARISDRIDICNVFPAS